MSHTAWSGFEVAFSLIFSALLINVALICRLWHGETLFTHITLQPYAISLALCTVMLCECTMYLYFGNIVFHGDFI